MVSYNYYLLIVKITMILITLDNYIIALQGFEFQESWSRSAYFGVSASTGSMTDFHDVISIKSYEVCTIYNT